MAVEANVHDRIGVAAAVVAMLVVIAEGENNGSVVAVEKVEEVVNNTSVESGAVLEVVPPNAGENVGSVGVGPVIVVPSGPAESASDASARRMTLSMIDDGIAIAQML